ncbi:Fur family transcriptional regulator [Sulfurimonas sp.]|uniref:Fur family transcriptional regulator n=1 Tax=Sulfurimonas sp. TaxID=2022749 RepID=UPI002B45CBF7|nr:transcriptional repressor [Sulfurimonas sp.]
MPLESTERYIDLFCSMLKSDKLKCTPIRQDILRAFFKSGHLSIEEILNQVKASKQSVYSTLKLLLSYKIITKQTSNKNIFYELTRGNDHYHLICSRCCEHVEFSDSELIELIDSLAIKKNFKTNKLDIALYGLCEKCDIDN